ncbi:hypothetical protein HMI54_001856 [Coelomomyces lativittatus]|nr:hypothetical protein HMI54_001856 [Coelomomyces lativittatus]KAJ1512953.1 hypothetical protein HMI55_006027 [Coelomomyces lativittatus]KAJ1515258.1 hypothetical protein HMI56_006195 [Coelomomyces lativittatus]
MSVPKCSKINNEDSKNKSILPFTQHFSSLCFTNNSSFSIRLNNTLGKNKIVYQPFYLDSKKPSERGLNDFLTLLDLAADWNLTTLHILINSLSDFPKVLELEPESCNTLIAPYREKGLKELAQESNPCFHSFQFDLSIAQPLVKLSSIDFKSFPSTLKMKKAILNSTEDFNTDPLPAKKRWEDCGSQTSVQSFKESTLKTSNWVNSISSASASDSITLLYSSIFSPCSLNSSASNGSNTHLNIGKSSIKRSENLLKRDFQPVRTLLGGWALKKDTPDFRSRAQKKKRIKDYSEKLRELHASLFFKKHVQEVNAPNFLPIKSNEISLSEKNTESPIKSNKIKSTRVRPKIKEKVCTDNQFFLKESSDNYSQSLDKALEAYFYDLELFEKLKTELNL